MSYNQVGKNFSHEKLLAAQQITKEVVQKVASRVFIGMSEEDGVQIIDEEFKHYGDFKFWHPHKFRIGTNTIKAFREISNPDVRLKDHDIFFIDVGPIIFEHEGDYGETFFTGDRNEFVQLKNLSQELYTFGKELFLSENLTGKDLYIKIDEKAREMGCILHPSTLGHRIGDFPHHLHFKGKLAEVDTNLSKGLWVLEIQVLNLAQTHAAFFEDII